MRQPDKQPDRSDTERIWVRDGEPPVDRPAGPPNPPDDLSHYMQATSRQKARADAAEASEAKLEAALRRIANDERADSDPVAADHAEIASLALSEGAGRVR